MVKYNKKDFSLEDIVLYNGILTKYGIIWEWIKWDDPKLEIRLANSEEKVRYYNRKEK